MKPLWLLIHLVGQVAWLGGGLSAMAIGIAAKREPPDQGGLVVRLQSTLYRTVIGPGAAAVVLSGILLTLAMYNRATAVGLPLSLMAMQGLGIVGALIILVHTVPTSTRLARLEPSGQSAAAFQGLRKRVVRSGMLATTLGMLALLAAALGK